MLDGYEDYFINFSLVILSGLVVVAGLEIALFVDSTIDGDENIQNRFIWCDGPESAERFHEEYGFTGYPNQIYLENRQPRTKPNEWHYFTFNSEGFRDTYDSGRENIIVLGDSFTEGKLADDNATYPHLLDRWSPNTTFQNYGKGGYGTDQELIVYWNISESVDHDLVIVGYYPGNDLVDNERKHVSDSSSPLWRPKFELDNGTLMQVHEPLNRTSSGRQRPRDQSAGATQKIQNFLAKNTRSYSFLAPKIMTTLDKLGIANYYKNESVTPDQKRLTKALLDEISSEASENDADVLILFLPTRGDVDPSNPYIRASEGYFDEQRKMVRSISQNQSRVYYLDLKPPLRNKLENGTQVYGQEDAHLNEMGYRIVGQSVHRWLAKRNYVTNVSISMYSETYDRNITSCPPGFGG